MFIDWTSASLFSISYTNFLAMVQQKMVGCLFEPKNYQITFFSFFLYLYIILSCIPLSSNMNALFDVQIFWSHKYCKWFDIETSVWVIGVIEGQCLFLQVFVRGGMATRLKIKVIFSFFVDMIIFIRFKCYFAPVEDLTAYWKCWFSGYENIGLVCSFVN